MLPGAGRQPIVSRQRVGVGTDVGSSLDVVMATENIGAAATLADIAERQLHDTGCANLVDADTRLGKPHAPDERAWAQVGDHLGDLFHLGCRYTRDAFGLLRGPAFSLLANVIETEHALGEI